MVKVRLANLPSVKKNKIKQCYRQYVFWATSTPKIESSQIIQVNILPDRFIHPYLIATTGHTATPHRHMRMFSQRAACIFAILKRNQTPDMHTGLFYCLRLVFFYYFLPRWHFWKMLRRTKKLILDLFGHDYFSKYICIYIDIHNTN